MSTIVNKKKGKKVKNLPGDKEKNDEETQRTKNLNHYLPEETDPSKISLDEIPKR